MSADREQFEKGGWNIGSIEEACEALDMAAASVADMQRTLRSLPRMTGEHDEDIAYYEAEVKATRQTTLNPNEYPALDAELARLAGVRRLIQELIAKSLSKSVTEALVTQIRESDMQVLSTPVSSTGTQNE